MTTTARLALAAALILLAAAVAALFVVERGGAPPPTDVPVGGQARTTAAAAEQAAGATPTPTPLERQSVRAGPDPTATSPTHLVVRVLDSAAEPLADAEVGAFVIRDSDDVRDSREAEQVAWSGEVLRSDATGEVRVPIDADALSWTLYGRRDELWGVLYVPARSSSEPQTLTLQRDLTVRARVLDPGGRPVAGVRVGLCDETGVEGLAGVTFRETVAPDGLVEFRHAQQLIRGQWGGDGAVLLGVPTRDPVFALLDFAALPADPVDLRLPGTGSLHITLVDAERRLITDLTDSVWGHLYELAESGERSHRLPFRDNALDMPYVGLGLKFRLELSSPEVRGLLEFDGPVDWLERVELELVVERQPTLSGRLVDADGAPQRGYWFATNVQRERGYYNQYFETGDDGLFHTVVPTLTDDPSARRSVLFRRTLPDLTQHAWVELDAVALHEGRNELGDVVLREPPVLASGRVVDDAGRGIAGAAVSVLQGTTDEAWPMPGYDDAGFVTDADGQFELRAHSIRPDLLLQAADGDNRGALMAFTAGTVGLQYVIPRVGEVVMPVAFEGALTPERALFFRVDRATGLVKGYAGKRVFEDGGAHWRSIPPGRYDFGVRVIGSPEPLVVVSDVEVLGGELQTLPAQQVGAGLHEILVEVVDEELRPVERAHVVVNPSAPSGPPRAALPTTLGKVSLLLERLPCELLVIAPGHRSRTLRGVTSDTVAILQSGLEVELAVDLPEGFPASDQTLAPRVRRFDPADPDPRPWTAGHELFLAGAGGRYFPERHDWLWSERVALDRAGRAAFRVPDPGEYVIEWVLRGAAWRELPVASRRRFSVGEGGGTTRVALSLTAEDVR